jgi:hypothetical protein
MPPERPLRFRRVEKKNRRFMKFIFQTSPAVESSTMHSPPGPKESPPDIKLRNPGNLIDQFLFFVCAFLLIPHRSILCFPVHVRSCRKRRNLNGWLMARCCVSHFNLLIVNFRNAILITEIPNTFLAFRIPFDSTSKLEKRCSGPKQTQQVAFHRLKLVSTE